MVFSAGFLVEVRGFEPLASSMRPRRSSQLSYTPAAGEFIGASSYTDHLRTGQPLATCPSGVATASPEAGRSG